MSCEDLTGWVSELPYFITKATKALVLAMEGNHEEAQKVVEEMERRIHEVVAGWNYDYSE